VIELGDKGKKEKKRGTFLNEMLSDVTSIISTPILTLTLHEECYSRLLIRFEQIIARQPVYLNCLPNFGGRPADDP